MQYPRYCTGYESDHIHNKVQQKRERGRRTKKKKKKKKEETEEEAVASWRHPCFVVIFPFLLFCVFYFFILGSDSMGCFMAPPLLRRRLLPFLLFFVFFFGSNSMGSREPWEPVWSWFLEPWGPTAVRMDPCFFLIERFLRLKELQNWTVRGFPGRTVPSDPGFKTLLPTRENCGICIQISFG